MYERIMIHLLPLNKYEMYVKRFTLKLLNNILKKCERYLQLRAEAPLLCHHQDGFEHLDDEPSSLMPGPWQLLRILIGCARPAPR